MPQWLIVVDWSSLTADLQWHWLRASVVVDGRSITLYEEVYARRHLANRKVHRRFVERLAGLLPPATKPPIIVTGAGFRTTWFRMIAAQGWHWIGRTRNRDFVRQAEQPWFPAKQLYTMAAIAARDLGLYEVVRNCPLVCRLVLVKMKPTQRQHRYPSGKVQRHTQAKKTAQCHREPWLLNCSPALAHLEPDAIARLYAQRMRIEQQFRDTKNHALGMGLSTSNSRGKRRLEALLLVAHIAQLTKRLIGEAAKAQQLALQLMTTNRHSRAELSVMTLATRVIERQDLLRNLPDPWQHWQTLRQQATFAITGTSSPP